MSNRAAKPGRMKVWGDSMLNKLPGISRKQRKRHASKIRRRDEKDDLRRAM